MRKPRKIPGVVRQYFFGQAIENTPISISCAFPLGASSAELLLDGLTRLTASESDQKGTLITLGAEQTQYMRVSGYATGAYANSFDSSTGTKALEVIPTLPAFGGTTGDTRLLFALRYWDVDTERSTFFLNVRQLEAGTYECQLGAGAAYLPLASLPERFGILLGSATSTVTITADGVELGTASYTGVAATVPHFAVFESAPISASGGGITVGMQLITGAADMTGTYPEGTTTICGDIL